MTRSRTGDIDRPWTDQDDSDLLDFDAEGWPLEQAAVFLGRDVAGCAARLEELKPRA